MTTHIFKNPSHIQTMKSPLCVLSEWGSAERQRLGPDPERRWHHADVRWHHREHRRHGRSYERDARRRSGRELWRGSGPRAGVRRPRAGDPRHPTGPAHGWFGAAAASGLPPPPAQERNDELNGANADRTSLSSLYHVSSRAISLSTSLVSEVAGLMSLPHLSLFLLRHHRNVNYLFTSLLRGFSDLIRPLSIWHHGSEACSGFSEVFLTTE